MKRALLGLSNFTVSFRVRFQRGLVGWIATVWIYPPEVLPSSFAQRVPQLQQRPISKLCGSSPSSGLNGRSKGMYLQVVQITQPALRNIGYKMYIIFAVFNFVDACIVWAFYPKTAGLTLESVDDLFRRDDEPAGSRKFGLQSSIVEKAAATVERVKRSRAAGVEDAVRSGMGRERESVECTEEVEVKD